MSDPTGIPVWQRIGERIPTSGQPSEAQLSEIAALGVRHIINLALHGHEQALPDEAGSVAVLGMRHVHPERRWRTSAMRGARAPHRKRARVGVPVSLSSRRVDEARQAMERTFGDRAACGPAFSGTSKGATCHIADRV